MKASRLNSFQEPLRIETIVRPKVTNRNVLVKVLASRIPAFTQGVVDGSLNYSVPPFPFTPGSGAVGFVEEVADDVLNLTKGQLVIIDPLIQSNYMATKPDAILLGWNALTPERHLQMKYKDGTWAEYVLVPVENVIPLPKSDYSNEQWVVIGYMGISYGALLKGGFKAGQVIVVNGATGTLGSSTVLLALAMGASRIIIVGRDESALKSLQQLDPKRVFPVVLSSSMEETTKNIQALAIDADYPKHQGAHLVIDAIGRSKTTDPSIACLRSLKPKGVLVFVGSVVPPIPISFMEVMVKEIEIRGSFMFPQEAFGDIIRMVVSSVLDLNKIKLVSFKLEDILKAISEAANLKGLNFVVVKP